MIMTMAGSPAEAPETGRTAKPSNMPVLTSVTRILRIVSPEVEGVMGL